MNQQNIKPILRAMLLGACGVLALFGCAPTDDKPPLADPPPTRPVQPTQPPDNVVDARLPTSEQWAALRQCEAGGNYQISDPSDTYHGAYQFNQQTWDDTAKRQGRTDLEGVKPSNATPADQDAMAVALYTRRGRQPWGGCGRKHLD